MLDSIVPVVCNTCGWEGCESDLTAGEACPVCLTSEDAEKGEIERVAVCTCDAHADHHGHLMTGCAGCALCGRAVDEGGSVCSSCTSEIETRSTERSLSLWVERQVA